jgi:hypothetical protein
MGRPFIPKLLGELSPEWLGEVLRDANGNRFGELRSVEAQVIGVGAGLMGEVVRLKLDWIDATEAAPSSVIAKLPSQNRRNRASGEIIGLYQRENQFYEQLAARLPISTPRFYFADMDPGPEPADPVAFEERLLALPEWLLGLLLRLGTGFARMSRRRYVLLLEDIVDLQCGDQVAGPREGEVDAALLCLAQFHAAMWEKPDLDATFLARIRNSERLSGILFKRAVRGFRDHYADRAGSDTLDLVDWLTDHCVDLMVRICEAPRTLVHMDYRLDNIFFDPTGEQAPVVFDWQLAAAGPAALDLAYFLCGTLSVEATRDEEDASLRLYHDELRRCGCVDYSWERLAADYRRACLAMLQRFVTASESVDVHDGRERMLMDSWLDRVEARLVGAKPDDILTA